MNGIIKVLTAILGVLAVVACLATVGIVGYSMLGGEKENTETTIIVQQVQPTEAPTPLAEPESGEYTEGEVPVNLLNHIHDYEVLVVKKATCYSAGRLQYVCECGENYFVDVLSTGHVADEWVISRLASKELNGLKVQKCIYCDEVIAQEIIYWVDDTKTEDEDEDKVTEPPHIHQYVSSVEREASCVLAGLRKYTCSCGNFYTEMIPAPGHVATDWTLAVGATSTHMGTEQRTCNVCGAVLDSRPTTKTQSTTSASASPSASASSSQATATPAATATSSPMATASSSPTASTGSGNTASSHQHSYTSYVLKESNCTEKGIRSHVCSCGSEYAESIELDMNNHTYRGVVIPSTSTTQGYTSFTCIRCNFSYFDNYSPILGQ